MSEAQARQQAELDVAHREVQRSAEEQAALQQRLDTVLAGD
jgi:hypothetical protein